MYKNVSYSFLADEKILTYKKRFYSRKSFCNLCRLTSCWFLIQHACINNTWATRIYSVKIDRLHGIKYASVFRILEKEEGREK